MFKKAIDSHHYFGTKNVKSWFRVTASSKNTKNQKSRDFPGCRKRVSESELFLSASPELSDMKKENLELSFGLICPFMRGSARWCRVGS